MVDKSFESISVAAKRYAGLSRKALDYGLLIKHLVDRAKEPDYYADEWDALKNFVAVDEFERVGNFKEVMSYDQMIRFLKKWCMDSHWEGSFKRITEHENVVILELEERNTYDGSTNVVNSVSIYEFNPEGKLSHLDVYLQMPMFGADSHPASAYE